MTYTYLFVRRDNTVVAYLRSRFSYASRWIPIGQTLDEAVEYLECVSSDSGFKQYFDLSTFDSVIFSVTDVDRCFIYNYNKKTITSLSNA